jgi:hypothetical protein
MFPESKKALKPNLPISRIVKTWWPLAASWLLMGIEVPVLSMVMARLANPEINLAAYGGIVYPISLIIEAPIIMLLSASVALCKDWATYQKIYRFMMVTGFLLTVLHALLAFTPLYDVIIRGWLGAPPETIEPGRIGLILMLPWTWSIGYRRFQQGVMIRFGHSEAVVAGTLIRLAADTIGVTFGFLVGTIPGIVVATCAQSAGVIAEAVFAGFRVQPILKNELRQAAPVQPLTWWEFARFYIPLALTSLLSLIWQPIGSAALSRMDQPLQSLAIWPVVSGLISVLRSFGYAMNETVVAMLDEARSSASLRRFTLFLCVTTTAFTLLITATPLAWFWFNGISALSTTLASMACIALWISTPLPALTVLQSWYQGAILFGKKTRAIPESIAIFFIVILLILGGGVILYHGPGIYLAEAGFVLAIFLQTAWLWLRSRKIMAAVNLRDSV